MPIKEVGRLINIVELPKVIDDAYLFFAESLNHLPFEIKRVYYITNPKPGELRGFHAHRKTNQVLFCIQGSVRVGLDNGADREEIILNTPEQGIFLPQMLWHEMHDMDESTILLVFADQPFDPDDYIRDYQEYLSLQ
jgi:dTDP-4-dehydrorhamnose 3,5-epimerase-like enzyme